MHVSYKITVVIDIAHLMNWEQQFSTDFGIF